MDWRIFKHPQTGHVIRVKQGFNWWVFFFGPLWYFFNDMIGHGLGWLIAAIVAASLINIPGAVIVWVIAGATANQARCNCLLSRGYIEVKDRSKNQN